METCPGFLRMSEKGGAKERERERFYITQPVSRHTVVITAVFAPIYSPPRYVTAKKLCVASTLGKKKKEKHEEGNVRAYYILLSLLCCCYCIDAAMSYIIKQMNKLTKTKAPLSMCDRAE